MGRHQGIASYLRSHVTIAQDEMRQHGEHGLAPRTLETPDADPTQPDTGIVRVARQAPATATGRLVFQLKPDGEDERQHQFNKGLAVAKELKVGRLILEIDGDGSVFAGLTSCVSHGSSSGQMVVAADDPRWG